MYNTLDNPTSRPAICGRIARAVAQAFSFEMFSTTCGEKQQSHQSGPDVETPCARIQPREVGTVTAGGDTWSGGKEESKFEIVSIGGRKDGWMDGEVDGEEGMRKGWGKVLFHGLHSVDLELRGSVVGAMGGMRWLWMGLVVVVGGDGMGWDGSEWAKVLFFSSSFVGVRCP